MAHDKERTQYLLSQPRTKEVVGELVKLNDRLIYKQLTRFNLLRDDDAISYAYEALFKAITTYDAEKDNAFSTYATVCIYNRLGSYMKTLTTGLKSVTSSYDEEAGDTGCTKLEYIESPLTADGDVIEKDSIKYINKIVLEQLKLVKTPSHKFILKIWIESEFVKPHEEIAKMANCSQSYVNQIINKFRKNLKYKLRRVQ